MLFDVAVLNNLKVCPLGSYPLAEIEALNRLQFGLNRSFVCMPRKFSEIQCFLNLLRSSDASTHNWSVPNSTDKFHFVTCCFLE